ncbi:serine/threonine-protein kinase [Glaciihabitans sp. dw_435]|uniref:serine/threonine-protein kinase n=1 Tax=Glaciihabitans sp. dw_435 TaxID=2720081 RepID=UPI0027DCE89D|nr:serine/threonine-protein kinase [Glaciihabitans sp. dw_435]
MSAAHPAAELNAPLLLGRYQPLRLVARGGASSVFLGIDENLGRNVAIKVFAAGDEDNVYQFRKEISVLAGLTHHGVVSITDAGIDRSSPSDARPFLVMEFVQGRTMREALRAGELTHREIAEISYEVAEALEYVHAQGVIHRDITPANIMLVDYGTEHSRIRAKLTDFGIAIRSGSRLPGGDAATGTPAYMSPEQVRNLPLTTASDIYSLGLFMLECFAGERAFPGDAATSAMARLSADPPIVAAVPVLWHPLIRWMTQRDAADRPSASQLAHEIRRVLRESGSRPEL